MECRVQKASVSPEITFTHAAGPDEIPEDTNYGKPANITSHPQACLYDAVSTGGLVTVESHVILTFTCQAQYAGKVTKDSQCQVSLFSVTDSNDLISTENSDSGSNDIISTYKNSNSESDVNLIIGVAVSCSIVGLALVAGVLVYIVKRRRHEYERANT